MHNPNDPKLHEAIAILGENFRQATLRAIRDNPEIRGMFPYASIEIAGRILGTSLALYPLDQRRAMMEAVLDISNKLGGQMGMSEILKTVDVETVMGDQFQTLEQLLERIDDGS